MAMIYTPRQLVLRMRKRTAAGRFGIRKAHRDLYTGGREDHAQFTSGRVSTDQLRDMGHPFARKPAGGARGVQNGATDRDLSRHVRGKGNRIRRGKLRKLPINRQTGALRRSFFQTAEQGRQRRVDMGFRVGYAPSVLNPRGTSRMVARGFYSSGSDLGIIALRHKARKAGIYAAVSRKIVFLT